ncbi:MAG TPA: protocatechuate 3,4-dioxygenase [Vineibacter sp.]|nr:protocatechuate 3,4-dioxygenase [Vineibacter sp.]
MKALPVPVARRRLLRAAAAAPALVAAPSLVRAQTLVPTPAQTEGPFYPVALPADSDNDLVMVRGGAAPARGSITHIAGRVRDTSGRPLAATRVEIWQCDWQGLYDHPGQSGRAGRDASFQGFGQMTTAADGGYRFRTIRPVAYVGRTPHIHFRVVTQDGRRLTTQMYVAGEPANERDFVLRAIRDDRQRQQIIVALAPADGIEPGALAGTFDIVLG